MPAVMAFESEASKTQFVGAVTLPWTKLALISASLEIRPENLVQWGQKVQQPIVDAVREWEYGKLGG